MAKETIKLLSASQVGTKITAVHEGFANTQTAIHEVALQCLAHAAEHGDFTLMQRLLGGITYKKDANGKRTKEVASDYPVALGNLTPAIKRWVSHYGPIAWSGDNMIGIIKPDAKTYKPFDLEGAAKTPYWEMEANKADMLRNPFDLLSASNRVSGLRKQFNTAKESGAIPANEKQLENYIAELEAVTKAYLAKVRFDPAKAEAARVIWKGAHVSPADKDRATVSGTIGEPAPANAPAVEAKDKKAA